MREFSMSHAGIAVGRSGGGSFLTAIAEDFQEADLEYAAINQRLELFELSP